MLYGGKKSPKALSAKLAKWTGFASFYQRFAPKMRLGNQPDMPTITTDRLWFLRENRFLFLTRDGPIEVTLKPSFVLTGILVCMVGVAAIFYYTLIASYSAIEVMRDETIQTAEANIGKKHIGLTTTSDITWREYPRSSPVRPLLPEITREQAQPFGNINDQIIKKPSTLVQQISPHSDKIDNDAAEHLPMIIQGGKRITFASQEKTGSTEILSDMPPSRELTKDPGRAPSPADSAKSAKTVIANTNAGPDLKNQRNTKGPLILADTKAESKTIVDTGILAETTSLGSVASEHMTKKDKLETSGLAARTKEFAVALLPSFVSNPNSIKPSTDNEETKDFEKKTEIVKRPELASKPGMASVIPEDGLLTSRNDSQNGPVLPFVSKAARIKKMLLAYRQEIDFIRSTVISLGISQEVLPAAPLLNNSATARLNDKEFSSLMIKVAEHRAALRKIPFKPPMLYFYVSSGYGMRKHPKTGNKTFHHGIDLAGTWQENVRTTAPGRVIYAGAEGAFGKVVRVQHEFGVVTTYAHLARITVKLDDFVSEGHVVGKMGNTGRSAGAHLHYEIRVNGKSIDPDKFMKIGRQLSVAGELRQSALVE